VNIKAVFICYKNLWLKALGLLLVALGIIGIVLPVMPLFLRLPALLAHHRRLNTGYLATLVTALPYNNGKRIK